MVYTAYYRQQEILLSQQDAYHWQGLEQARWKHCLQMVWVLQQQMLKALVLPQRVQDLQSANNFKNYSSGLVGQGALVVVWN